MVQNVYMIGQLSIMGLVAIDILMKKILQRYRVGYFFKDMDIKALPLEDRVLLCTVHWPLNRVAPKQE